jgi:hypothetical protein
VRATPRQERAENVTLNLESVLLIENKLQRIASIVKQIRVPTGDSSRQAVESFEAMFRDLIELCEDYWYILRKES